MLVPLDISTHDLELRFATVFGGREAWHLVRSRVVGKGCGSPWQNVLVVAKGRPA